MRAARVIPTALLAGLFLTLPGTLPGIDRLGGPPTAEAATAASAAEQMLTLVNAERRKAGCAAVRLDARPDVGSEQAQCRHGHERLLQPHRPQRRRLRDADGGRGSFDAAARRTSPPATRPPRRPSTRWMDSAGHRRNILDCSAKDMGVGVATDPGSTYGI